MRILYVVATAFGAMLLTLYCLPRYGKWSLWVIFPVGLLFFLGGKALFAARIRKDPPAGEPAMPASAQSLDGPATIEDALARIAMALKTGGGHAAEAEVDRLCEQRVQCHDCGNEFLFKDGLTLGQPLAHRVPSPADRERLFGYTVECPACQKGGFVGKPIA